MFKTFFKTSKKKLNSIDLINLNSKYDNEKDLLYHRVLEKKQYKNYLKRVKEIRKKRNETYLNNNKIYLIKFKGDMKASKIDFLRNATTSLLRIMKTKDEVLILIESPGGLVSNYGLAASQIERFRKNNIRVTVLIDLVAASGGYLMACVANKIISAPFAIVGSIGVVAQIPNIHRFLEKLNIDVEQHTSGQYKRTLTLLGKNDEKGRKKFIQDLKNTHDLFKMFVKKYRPEIDIDKVSTGEYWYGLQALDLNLIDEIKTSDEFIFEQIQKHQIYEIKMNTKSSIKNKIQLYINNIIYDIYYKIINKFI